MLINPDEKDAYARKWMDDLAKGQLASVEYHEPKGNVFLDVSIEGERFQGSVFGNSLMIGNKNEGACSLGVASINFVSMPNRGPKTWAVCKYGSQWSMSLSLSEGGRRRLALEFGIPVVPLLDQAAFMMVDDPAFFYNSSAFKAIQKWARSHPRKIVTLCGDSYLHLWPLSAIVGKQMEVNEESIALSRDKTALMRVLKQYVDAND